MSDSILIGVKKILGLDESYEVFDFDVITHINTALATLTQLGVGPENGFMIVDDTSTWEEFIGDDHHLNPVKTYLYLRVRYLFDPPERSFHNEAILNQIREFEWRLNVHKEDTIWRDPNLNFEGDDYGA